MEGIEASRDSVRGSDGAEEEGARICPTSRGKRLPRREGAARGAGAMEGALLAFLGCHARDSRWSWASGEGNEGRPAW